MTITEEDQDASPDVIVPFFRVTVLGPSDSGKTCLINSWVNNYCPTVYQATQDPTLYYRTIRMSNPMREEELVSALVEVEDTYSWSRKGGTDSYGNEIDLKQYMDCSPNPQAAGKYMGSFADYNANHEENYTPLSKGRMAFIILYDSSSEDSFKQAKEIYEELLTEMRRKNQEIKEISIHLVANKVDKDPLNLITQTNIKNGKAFAMDKSKTHPLGFAEVSALKFIRVRKLFRDIVEQVSKQPKLWLTDSMKEYWDSRHGGKAEKCSIQ
eukprot:TRINITY_DN67106_c0_g1_i1.p1 TRINITY_DN67106_c0_g1~~TRINITY_DN67106_c0_g1_i1.p1  ORF type:complete len:280 (-),score=42.48 TRINITY_DN67106_c0_g1_i1:39-845(-)